LVVPSSTAFFAFAFILGLYSLRLLAAIEERGEIKERISVQNFLAETRRSMHSLSSAAGLQKLARFPASMLRGRRP
jgi:hypothetical protein